MVGAAGFEPTTTSPPDLCGERDPYRGMSGVRCQGLASASGYVAGQGQWPATWPTNRGGVAPGCEAGVSREPDWSVHPGEILREKLAEMGLSGSQAANRMGVSQPHMAQILSGRTGVGPVTAIKLEALTGISAEMWLGLASRHALLLARQAHRRSRRTPLGTKLSRTI